jgi:hypothetical protein
MDFLLDLFKKWGVPTAILAIVATLGIALPAFFFIDDRYAKAQQMQNIYVQLNQLTQEVSQLAGTEQVLVAVITSNSGGKVQIPAFTTIPPAVQGAPPIASTGAQPPVSVPSTDAEKTNLLNQVTTQVQATQEHLQTIQQNLPKQ